MRQMEDLSSTEIVCYRNKIKIKYIHDECFIISSSCLARYSVLYYALIKIKVLQ